MYKETIICIITVILIFIINEVACNYTKNAVNELTTKLSELREEILTKNIDKDKANLEMYNIFELWNSKYKVLAYYLEHDELEKIEINLNSLYGEIETEEYDEAVSELDRTNFILHHIERKNKFDWKNVF